MAKPKTMVAISAKNHENLSRIGEEARPQLAMKAMVDDAVEMWLEVKGWQLVEKPKNKH